MFFSSIPPIYECVIQAEYDAISLIVWEEWNEPEEGIFA